ncbi:hypothetical protein KLP40_14875 [Hymenobacter sp. NST-14]|uniref:hypothetical protein n=1 Tax=Hymenobacter piscis TaxID=2839984 RepID=UPI001C0345C7|nr:hypothetical protein [Hymenobacter piscis]MBT9394453.1 hypothetical protein [Hymenobacter piscis]
MTHIPSFRQEPWKLNEPGNVYFLASQFCELFGHSSAALFSRPTSQQLDYVFRGAPAEHLETYGKCRLDTTLYAMCERALMFSNQLFERNQLEIGKEAKLVQTSLKSVQVFKELEVRHSHGNFVSYQFLVGPVFRTNNHVRPQLVDLADYTSLRTPATAKEPTGRCWVAGRYLYLYLQYVRGVMSSEKNRHLEVFHADFNELCAMISETRMLTDAEKAQRRKLPEQELRKLDGNLMRFRASNLRAALKRVCELPSVGFTARVEAATPLEQSAYRDRYGKEAPAYIVTLQRKHKDGRQAA